MKNVSQFHAGASRVDVLPDDVSQSTRNRHLAEAVRGDLMMIGMPRVNVLLSGMDGVVQNILETILADLETPIASWSPGERLVLPPVARVGTMILHEVGAMNREDQQRLLDWSEEAAGKTQIVSTASLPLLPLVSAGTFSDTLYYRLNTVFVDATC